MTGPLLHFRQIGDESLRPLLFLHGFMGSAEDFARIAEELSDIACSYLVDLPGHGKSTRGFSVIHDMVATVDAIHAVVLALKTKRLAMTGYSMGGRVALYYILMYPERVDHLILESCSPGIEDEAERKQRTQFDLEWAKKLELEGMESFLNFWYAQPLFESLRRNPSLLRAVISARRANDAHALANSLRGIGVGSMEAVWDRLPEITIPTLLLCGQLDKKYTDIMTRMKGTMDNSRLTIAPEVGHNVHLESRDYYITHLRRILTDNDSSGG